MKAEKEEERQVSAKYLQHAQLFIEISGTDSGEQRRIQAIKDKRAAKEEKERYAKLAEKMHKKRVERLRRREKRNKKLNS